MKSNIRIGNKEYKVKEATTDEEKMRGLLGISELPSDEGMLFYFDPPQEVSFWMKDVEIPLDIVFINEDLEVIKIYKGKPMNENLMTVKDVAYVLEVNTDSDIKVGDDLDIMESGPVMKVLALDGSDQYELWGGERIFSRKNTRILIKKAKKAESTLEDKDYKALGKYIFKCIKKLDTRDPEFVPAPEKGED